jgi:muramoyltetrapeptide carboxypeptidase
VGIVAPASSFRRAEFDAGCDALRRMGYVPVSDDSIFDHDLYFAGSVERRVRELQTMFARDDVKAVLCVRGGYGANYLLPALDFDRIARTPKIFAGYSDITTLLTFMNDRSGMVALHAPMLAKDFSRPDGVDLDSWQNAVSGANNWQLAFDAASGVCSLVNGSAEGVLYGGCLSMLVASLGTPYEIQTAGTILFIEDVATKPYQLDRMLMHLKLAGKLSRIKGLIFGEMLDCVQGPKQDYTLPEVILRIVADMKVPVAYGLRSGHVSRQNITLPMGVSAVLNCGEGGVSVEITEPATVA